MLIIPIKNKTLKPPELEKFIPVIEEESKITKDESLRLYKSNNNDTFNNTLVQEEKTQTLANVLYSKKFLSCIVMAFCTSCNFNSFINI